MPYIDPILRKDLDPSIEQLYVALDSLPTEFIPGCLNYIISKLSFKLIARDRGYATMSCVRGAIGDAYDEFYRRLMIPYEDEKIKQNGDVV